ncbi:7397_t:CDS:2 [Funneliformis geosporum]|nr:7397_t:CDS:2 [Funneliformis geosporum]
MSDSDSMFSDDSDNEIFPEEFLNNIPEDSDEDCFFEASDSSTSTLTLEEGRSEKLQNERRKQTILCKYEVYIPTNQRKISPNLQKLAELIMYIHGHLNPLSIKQMLKAKYNKKVYNQDFYKVIYKYNCDDSQLGNDVSQLFVHLEKAKEKDSRWSTIVSSAFANIIEELKLFTLPQIQKIHYSKMEMAFSYDAKLLDQTYINNETLQDWSFADGFIENQEIRQITF